MIFLYKLMILNVADRQKIGIKLPKEIQYDYK